MANNKTYNICGNWGLKCFSQHIVSNNNGIATGVILSCTLNGKKKQDGSYPKGIQVSVFCPLDGTCNIQECDYSNTLIDVNGTIGVREYTNKNNQFVSTLSIYASSVSIHEWKNGNNNGGGNNYRNNGNNRPNNNGYNNNGYNGNNGNNGYNGGNNGNYRQGNNRNNGYNNNGGYGNNYGNNGYNNGYNGGYNGGYND